ncbi:MAG: hypothetical protein DMG32_11015 [Acidobacteria bacterium]|nr:MAG: hypothetical protein DMG32_11015 [Acidobacteriota bacterium]
MKKIGSFIVLLLLAPVCFSQSQGDADQTTPHENEGLIPLDQPYAISTAPHFAILVQFPKADSIRRIALGDSNYFLAEADKDDPHYAIVKQIQTSSEKGKPPIETNMLVYMASGRVINIMLEAGKLAETAYSIDYPVPHAQPEPQPAPPPAISPEVLEKGQRERARRELSNKMLDEVRNNPKKEGPVIAGGLNLHFYRMERMDEWALVSFDVENTSAGVIDLEDPRINLVTTSDNGKDRKKNIPAKVEPVQISESFVSVNQLRPGARAVCLVTFKPPIHDRDQQVVLSVLNRAMADRPATFRIE